MNHPLAFEGFYMEIKIFTSTQIPLANTSHMAKPEIRMMGNIILPQGGEPEITEQLDS